MIDRHWVMACGWVEDGVTDLEYRGYLKGDGEVPRARGVWSGPNFQGPIATIVKLVWLVRFVGLMSQLLEQS